MNMYSLCNGVGKTFPGIMIRLNKRTYTCIERTVYASKTERFSHVNSIGFIPGGLVIHTECDGMQRLINQDTCRTVHRVRQEFVYHPAAGIVNVDACRIALEVHQLL